MDAHLFKCPYGCEHDEVEYRGAWLVYKHQEMARLALTSAALYSVNKQSRYADIANHILADYAKQYPHYPEHPDAQPWMLKGRAFHQALTEAIWSTTLIRAYLLLKDEGVFDDRNEALLHTFFQQLESSMTVYRKILIEERKQPENNYTAWLNACLACVYAATQDHDKMKALTNSKGGLHHHLSIAIRPDQLEFEGSTYYHIFVLRAYFIAAEMAERLDINLYDMTGNDGQTYKGMLDALVSISAPDGQLPALHDGPYQRLPFARETVEIFEIGLARYKDQRYVPILREAYRQIWQQTERTGLEALLYGSGELEITGDTQMQEDSRLFSDSGFVVGRQQNNPLFFLADFGPHGGSHGHDDKLNLVVMHDIGFVLPERGMVPYGSDLRKTWFSRTQSHNTVSIGGKTQQEHTGTCRRFENKEHYTYAWLHSDSAYSGAVLERHLCVTEHWLLDWFHVSLEQSDTIEWWLHALHGLQADKGTTLTPLPDATLHGEDPAYEMMQAVASCRGSEQEPNYTRWHSKLPSSSNVSIALLAPSIDETIFFRAAGTSLDPSLMMDGLVHRHHGKEASFIAVYTDGDTPAVLRWEEASDSKRGQVVVEDGNSKTSVVLDEQGLHLSLH